MKVLKFTLLVLFAASLTTLLSPAAQATDHPWDDSTVDSTTTTGVHDAGGDVPETPEETATDVPIVVKTQIMIYRFFSSFFTLEIDESKEVQVGTDDAGYRVRGTFNWRKYRADIR